MSPVLVLGSNSFSGASFVKYLLEQGLDVIGASRSIEAADVFLPYKWLRSEQQRRFRFVQLDLNYDLAKLEALMRSESISIVANFAAQSMVGESWEKPDDWMQTNVVAVSRLAERLRHLDFLEKYIHITTPEVYGSTDGWITEDTPFKPSTPYAVSRAAGDMLFKIYQETFGLPMVATRAANVYGQGQPLYRIIPRAMFFLLTGRTLDLHGGGMSTRSFIHIDDVNRATWQIAQHSSVGEVYHISTDRIISIKDLVMLICEKLGARFDTQVKIVGERLGKDNAYWLSSSKLRDDIGWRDEVSLEVGLDQCLAWVKSNQAVLNSHPINYIHKP
jgi:dTDP-glucose 4,6-dehydratase